MGPIRGRQDPGGPHVGPMNFAIWLDAWENLQIPPLMYNIDQALVQQSPVHDIIHLMSTKKEIKAISTMWSLILLLLSVLDQWG